MITGATLTAAGLSQRTLEAWVGNARIPIVAARVIAGAKPPAAPGLAVLALFVVGVDVPRVLVPEIDDELDADLVEVRGTMVRARVAILPVGRAKFVVCDRLDAAPHEHLVCWPDDSSYHLAASIPKLREPGRLVRWLDLGTGSAFAPLVRPEVADRIVASDVVPRALDFARRGLALSRLETVELVAGDLATGSGSYELVTCNAPIPDGLGVARWRTTATDFVARLVATARPVIARAGTFVVHAALDALEPVLRGLPGERVLVAYTPPDAERGFAVAWWQPDGEDRLVLARRALDADRPHVEHTDRDAARAGTLPAL